MRGVAEAGSRNKFCWLTNVNVTFFHGKPTKFHTGSLRRFAPWFWIESSCYARTLSPKLRLGRLSPPIAQDDRLKYYFVIPLKKNRSLKRQMQKESLNTTHLHSALDGKFSGCSALFGALQFGFIGKTILQPVILSEGRSPSRTFAGRTK